MSISTAAVIPLRRMSEAEYDAARAKLPANKKDARYQAGVRWEQELAMLFWRSGWTQEELAAKEGTSPQRMAQQVRFGRFLNFSTNVEKIQTIPNNLSEGKFRGYWVQTDKDDDERERFAAIVKLMKEDVALHKPKRSCIGQKIKEKFADAKWHDVVDMANLIGEEVEHVRETLDGICKNQTYGCKAEKKRVGAGFAYRLFETDRAVPLAELLEKLTPILKGFEAEGKKNAFTAAPAAVAILANKLRKLLAEWSERSSGELDMPSDDRMSSMSMDETDVDENRSRRRRTARGISSDLLRD